MIRRFIIALVIAFLLDHNAHAHNCADVGSIASKTCTASGSKADTLAAVNYIQGRAESGWVLTTGTNGESYDWFGLTLTINHPMTLRGGAGGVGPTIAFTSGDGSVGIQINCAPNTVLTLDHFNLPAGGRPGNLVNPAAIIWSGSGEVIRLTNMTVAGQWTDVFWLWLATEFSTGGEGPFGVFDNSTVYGYPAMFIRQNQDSPDAKWTNASTPSFGTRKAFFIEDVVGHGENGDGTYGANAPSFICDGNHAGRVVVRHSTLNNMGVAWHGRDSDSRADNCLHGFLMGEIYNVTFNISRTMDTLIMIRSGTAWVLDNTLNLIGSGSLNNGIQLQVHCADASNILAGEFCRNADEDCSFMTEPLTVEDRPDQQQPGFPYPIRTRNNSNADAINNHLCGNAYIPGCTPADGWAIGSTDLTFAGVDYINGSADAYTKFTYPHPLVSGAEPEPTPTPPPLILFLTP
jgi:hypothetical protein